MHIFTFVLKQDEKHIEADLINQIRNGDKDAFSRLYDMYSANLYGVCLKILGSDELAEDVVQESFIKVWKRINTFDPTKGRLFTWLLNITRNTAIDALRKNKKNVKTEIQTLDFVVNISGRLSNGPVHNFIRINEIGLKELVSKLPQEQQQVIDILYFKGYTQQEAADELEIPLGTIKTRSRNAIQELRKLFDT